MTRLPVLLAAVAALASFGAHAAGKVDVTLVKPEGFFDTGVGFVARERNLKTLTEFMEKLGKNLPDGQTLSIEVLDVDLAGQVNPMSINEIRVLRGGSDWPKMTVRYKLQDGSTTVKTGEDRIADTNYMINSLDGRYASRELGYEKRMIQRWFDDKIVSKKIAEKAAEKANP